MLQYSKEVAKKPYCNTRDVGLHVAQLGTKAKIKQSLCPVVREA